MHSPLSQALLELRVSSMGAFTPERGPATRWSEAWGIALHVGQPFIVTEDQLRFAGTGTPPKKVCMFTLEGDQVHCTIIDRGREATFNLESRTEGACAPGDRIVIGGSVLIEVLRAPAAPKAPSLAASFEHGLENIFRTLEDGLAIPPLLEEAAAPTADGPTRSLFSDRPAIEVPQPAEAVPPAPSPPPTGSAALRAFTNAVPLPLAPHRPDDFLRPRAAESAFARQRLPQRRRPAPPRPRRRVSVGLLALLGAALALLVSAR